MSIFSHCGLVLLKAEGSHYFLNPLNNKFFIMPTMGWISLANVIDFP